MRLDRRLSHCRRSHPLIFACIEFMSSVSSSYGQFSLEPPVLLPQVISLPPRGPLASGLESPDPSPNTPEEDCWHFPVGGSDDTTNVIEREAGRKEGRKVLQRIPPNSSYLRNEVFFLPPLHARVGRGSERVRVVVWAGPLWQWDTNAIVSLSRLCNRNRINA